MSNATQRVICRWIHILCGVPILGYIYSPFEELHNFASIVRFVFLPLVLLSGLWMWKGPLVLKLFARKEV